MNGENTVEMLNNQAAMHAITKIDNFKFSHHATDNDSTAFHFTDRYSAAIFQGIMPDTGASGISTAGENQFHALQKKDPRVVLNTKEAGVHRVKFGDNPDLVSLGTATVKTPFGSIDFHVMPANTPFLFCIKDMDRLRVFLNNVRNVLVHGGVDYPIVRKWGHP